MKIETENGVKFDSSRKLAIVKRAIRELRAKGLPAHQSGINGWARAALKSWETECKRAVKDGKEPPTKPLPNAQLGTWIHREGLIAELATMPMDIIRSKHERFTKVRDSLLRVIVHKPRSITQIEEQIEAGIAQTPQKLGQLDKLRDRHRKESAAALLETIRTTNLEYVKDRGAPDEWLGKTSTLRREQVKVFRDLDEGKRGKTATISDDVFVPDNTDDDGLDGADLLG